MAMSGPGLGGGREVTRRPVLGSYDNYEGARSAVDRLSDAGFPVQNVAIVGVDLRLVESVLGRRSWGRAALGGMATGAWFGLLIGLFVSLFAEGDGTFGQLVMLGVLYGAAFGIVFGLISHALTRGRHDFLSRQALVATRYDVHCEAAVIGQARQILQSGGAGSQWPPPLPPEPPTGPGADTPPSGSGPDEAGRQ